MDKEEKKIYTFAFVFVILLLPISLAMPYITTNKVCESLGLEYKSTYTACVDSEGNHWSLHTEQKEGERKEWVAIKCIENLCLEEYGRNTK